MKQYIVNSSIYQKILKVTEACEQSCMNDYSRAWAFALILSHDNLMRHMKLCAHAGYFAWEKISYLRFGVAHTVSITN